MSHSSSNHGSLKQLFLPQDLLDILTPVYKALVLLTGFGMIATQSDKLLANWTSTTRLSRTLSDMGHNFLHLMTGHGLAIGISTLGSMNQALDTPLDSIEVVGIIDAVGSVILVCGSISFPYI